MAVLLLAIGALGLLAYVANQPKAVPVAEGPAPLMVSYIIAAHPLPAGTLARDEDFTTRSVASVAVPAGAITDTPEAKIGLRGSLVRTYLDTGSPVTSADVLRPRDRGFLASVLEPGTRAISINVDAESGVSGLIWPGDHVDVVVTHELQNANADHKMASETVLQDVRIIAIDQEIVQGAPSNNVAAGKVARTVTLQLQPEQVERVTVAEKLGRLSLAMRSAVQAAEVRTPNAVFGGDVSPAIAHESANTTVVVYENGAPKEYKFRTP
jgi:pilus assembly protein CpaB